MAFSSINKMLVGCALAGVAGVGIAADVHPFNGSSWRVASINGEASRSASNTISFAGDMVTGRLGCNDFGGKVAASDAGLSITALRATSRTCGDDAAMFEGDGFAVLSQPLRMEWATRDQLVLASANGRMTLERLP